MIQPGASIRQIRLAFPRSRTLRIGIDGALIVTGSGGELRHEAPVSYQEIPGGRRMVASRYRINGRQVGFEANGYDSTKPLVIDPIVTYIQDLGGSGNDIASAITTDSAGNIYVAGSTNSTDFPQSSAVSHSSSTSQSDAFVTKLDPQGKVILYSLFFGGNDDDQVADISVDTNGSAYITGTTKSSDFPATPGAFRGPGKQSPYLTWSNSTRMGPSLFTPRFSLMCFSIKDH